jgi:hypothetical protein
VARRVGLQGPIPGRPRDSSKGDSRRVDSDPRAGEHENTDTHAQLALTNCHGKGRFSALGTGASVKVGTEPERPSGGPWQ